MCVCVCVCVCVCARAYTDKVIRTHTEISNKIKYRQTTEILQYKLGHAHIPIYTHAHMYIIIIVHRHTMSPHSTHRYATGNINTCTATMLNTGTVLILVVLVVVESHGQEAQILVFLLSQLFQELLNHSLCAWRGEGERGRMREEG